jgi:hypothetical protein
MGETSAGAAGSRGAARERAALRARSWLSGMVEHRPLTAPEVVAVTAFLTLVAAVALGSYVLHGGFYSDDWVQAVNTRYPKHGGILGHLRAFDSTRYRPGQYLYYPAIHSVLGLHMKAYLVWASLCAVAMSGALYAFLRVQGLRRLESVGCATLVLLFPYSSSTRLWSSTCITSIAITLYLVGTLLVLRALSGRSSHPRLLHVAGVAIVCFGVMTYEVVAPAALLSVLLYLRVTGRRRAVRAWLIDVVLVGAILAFITSGRQQEVATVGGELSHAWLIVRQSVDLWAGVLVPYGSVPTRLAFGGLIVVALVAALVARLSSRSSVARRDLVFWLVVLGAGIFAIAVGYAMFLPADQYYSPATLGIGDRTNGFAAIGWCLAVVAAVRLAATVAFRDVRRSNSVIAVAVAITLSAIGLGYADRLRAEADVYTSSYRDQVAILDTLHRALPAPPHNSTIYLVRHTAWAGLGVPVYAQWWEFYGAVRLTYHDPTLWAYPIVPPTSSMSCGPRSVITSPREYGTPAPYGRAFVLDMATQQIVPLPDAATCRSVVLGVGVATPPA